MKKIKSITFGTMALSIALLSGCSSTGANLGRTIDGTGYNPGGYYYDQNGNSYGTNDGYGVGMWDSTNYGTTKPMYGTGYSDSYGVGGYGYGNGMYGVKTEGVSAGGLYDNGTYTKSNYTDGTTYSSGTMSNTAR